jgi:cytochrome c oxidase subunit 2
MKLPFFPEAASALAGQVDLLFLAVTIMTGTVAIGVTVLMLVFTVKYRRGHGANRVRAPGAVWRRTQRAIEVTWITIPLLLFMGTFVWASALYFDRSAPPDNAVEVAVVAKQWMWRVDHASGAREIDELHVPVNIPVKLVMTSQDVIHSFYVPEFRVKQDVLPGRYTVLWFTATKAGDYHLFCSEYCGTDHAHMLGHVIVLDAPDFQRWLSGQAAAPSMATRGEMLYANLGCAGCHGPHAAVRAPSLDGLYGHMVPLADGSFVLADDHYLRDAILLPNAQLVAGYAPVMPSFAGQVSEGDLLDIIAYLKRAANKESVQ